ncbi:hypothetical protein [Bradyrhizobium macuxiense]|uniref:hypothetical protein n=1 Tax=Bradyrhizobium macuxiense TaxID=1755647 RepID=UPI0011BEE0D5|nr:hypothetical protein [Bradyrhizobium macuxiense]
MSEMLRSWFSLRFFRSFDRRAASDFPSRTLASGTAQPPSPMSDEVLAHAMRDLEDLQRDLSAPDHPKM